MFLPVRGLWSNGHQDEFEVVRSKPIAKMWGEQDNHGWITAALQRKMERLEGQATFENVDSRFPHFLVVIIPSLRTALTAGDLRLASLALGRLVACSLWSFFFA